jgi:hypothetical protein
MTWFRAESNVHWLSGFGADPEIIARTVGLVASAFY